MKSHVILLLLSMASLLVSGCQVNPGKHTSSLYEELGGEEGIDRLVVGLINESIIDRRIEKHFEKTDLDRLHRLLVEQICELSGGPCQYSGDSMKLVHRGMRISEGEFNALVEALMQAMDDLAISVSAQNQLLAILAPMRVDIIHQ